MCHMWADTVDELLAMADRIGVQRKWIQGHPTLSFGKHRNASWIHFDIAESKRVLAVRHGAIETDLFGPVEFEAKRDIASGDAERMLHGQQRLARVEKSRSLRSSRIPVQQQLDF